MAQVINRSQQVVTAGLNPMAAYSRQVGVEVHVPAGVGAEGFKFTPVMGQQIRLLGIDFWAFRENAGAAIGGFITIASGTAEPTSVGEIATKWEPCMQYVGIKPMMYWLSHDDTHFHWDMNKLYTGSGRRFACGIQNFSAVEDWWAWVFFQVSEG